MTEVLTFTVTFHSPFAVATGRANSGYDLSIDPEAAMPATALKGLMRAAARDTLGLPPEVVERVFGSTRTPSRWHWVVEPFDVTQMDVHRVQINADTGAAIDGALLSAQVGIAESAVFTVETAGTASDEDRLVLTASARAVHAFGSSRRRGLGWVGIEGGGPLNIEDCTRLVGMRV